MEALGREGEALVRVTARLAGLERQAESRVVITEVRNPFGIPPPEPVHASSEAWRSQYSREIGVLRYNTGHRDYQRAKAGGGKAQVRYLATLYAKELVLLNLGSASAPQLLESMVELTTVLESKL